MIKLFINYLVAFAFFAISARGTAHGQGTLPELSVNKAPEICLGFEAAWRDLYESDYSLSVALLNLPKYLPDADFVFKDELPETEFHKVNASRNRLSLFQTIAKLDLNEDGEQEVLAVTSYENIRYGYVGLTYHVFETLDDFERFKDEDEKVDWRLANSLSNHARFIGLIQNQASQTVIRHQNDLLVPTPFGSLVKLEAADTQTPVCTVTFPKPDLSLESADALSNIKGGPVYGCRQQIAPGFGSPEYYINDVVFRPQHIHRKHALLEERANNSEFQRNSDTYRELRYIGWGISDPHSWRVLEDLKSSTTRAIMQLERFYIEYLNIPPETAREYAEISHRYRLDQVYYARNSGPFLNVGDIKNLSLTPDMSLNAMADIIVKEVMSDAYSDSAFKYHWPRIALFGAYAGVDNQQMRVLIERGLSVQASDLKQQSLDDLLLAALGNRELTDFLIEKGADVESHNAFRKTPLMYGAQLNDLWAVYQLIGAGADINAKTDSTVAGHQCNFNRLERDHRTALMYAAENASASLVLMLIEEGADVTAKDTQGNGIFWYLDKNNDLTKLQKNNIKSRLSHRKDY